MLQLCIFRIAAAATPTERSRSGRRPHRAVGREWVGTADRVRRCLSRSPWRPPVLRGTEARSSLPLFQIVALIVAFSSPPYTRPRTLNTPGGLGVSGPWPV